MIDAATQWASQDAGTLPWVAVAGYVAGAALCGWQRGCESGRAPPRERLFWTLAALAMLALGINKQLDLQTALTAFGRQWARSGGWYEQRRAFQAGLVMAAVVAAVIAAGALGWLVRGLRAGVIVALAGLCLLGLFVLIRAASFHHIDVALRTAVLGLKLHAVLELAGIAVVIAGALLRSPRPAPGRRPGYHR
ncbi:hypothetical protein [Sandarakinorhabdus sp.]|uniref:hypothetical protein n=1 Tax=Sandarakinorhabdus sp. TaxID=1916663 RepID=UPI00286E2BEF|nr:hypothetical protein [Sandarakinorhabdus sp.]